MVKLAALGWKKQKPEDENAENYEVYLYRLLTNLEEVPWREHATSVLSVASGTHIPSSSQSVHESHRSSRVDDDVICVPDDSPPSSSQQAMQQASSSKPIPEKSNTHNTSTSTQTYMQQSSTLTPTTLAMRNERSFNSTLTEGAREGSFDDERSTPVSNKSQIHGLLRRESSNESLQSERSAAPPRKGLKTTLDRSQRSRSASVHWEEEMSNEAMDPGQAIVIDPQEEEVLLTNIKQPGKVKVLPQGGPPG